MIERRKSLSLLHIGCQQRGTAGDKESRGGKRGEPRIVQRDRGRDERGRGRDGVCERRRGHGGRAAEGGHLRGDGRVRRRGLVPRIEDAVTTDAPCG